METIFLICAVLGGTIMVCQFVLTMLGLAGHGAGDVDQGGFETEHHDPGGGPHHDHGADGHGHGNLSSWFFGVLSFRTLTAAAAFFGLAGLATSAKTPEGSLLPLVVASAAGIAAMFLVAWVMRALHHLHAEGTVRVDRAVGALGTVYVTIPGQKSAPGKVTLKLQNRTIEYEAVTAAPSELPTGTKVKVVAVVAPRTVEVAPVA